MARDEHRPGAEAAPRARPVRSARQLWWAVHARGGLQPKRPKSGLLGFDHAFVGEVIAALGLPENLPVSLGLWLRSVTLEELLQALLTATQPWARMMADILAMLESAGAERGGDGIEIELDLDRLAPKLRQSLDAFRRQAAEAARVVRIQPGRQWGAIDVWNLEPEAVDSWQLREGAPVGTTPMLEWARAYRVWPRERPGGREPPPSFRTTGQAAYDRELARLRELLESFVETVRILGPSYSDRMAYWHRLPFGTDEDLGGGWTAQKLAGAESDFFAPILAETFELLGLQPDFDAERAAALADELRAKLDLAPEGPAAVQAAQEFLDLLDLPAWQRRHELYSVWISTILAAELPEDRSWELSDGTLSYAFGGSCLARGPMRGSTWALWAELNRPLPPGGSGKRTEAAQPDYSVIFEGFPEGRDAALVVECKQYRIPSRKNFRDALFDYALTHREAHVLLANYGPVPPRVDEDLATGRTTPVEAFGHVHPSGDGLPAFREAVARAVTAMEEMEILIGGELQGAQAQAGRAAKATAPHDSPAASPAAEIRLEWDGPTDLDLHLVFNGVGGRTVIDYGNRGTPEEFPYAWLDRDVRAGPGRETIRVERWQPGSYEVIIRRFQGDWPERFTVGVTLDGTSTTFTPLSPDGDSITIATLERND